MKVALLATLVAFGGSIAGFGLTSGVSGAPSPDRAAAPAVTEDVIVRGHDRDCPKAKAERT
jgi:hypothetical protein